MTAIAPGLDLDGHGGPSGRPPLAGSTVLFDWNGTLVDDRHRAWAAARATLAVCAPDRDPLGDDALSASWRVPVTAFFIALGVPADRAPAAERLWNVEMATVTPTLRNGAIDLLTELRRLGATVGVVSAGLPSMVLRDVIATGVAGSLDVLFAGVGDKRDVLGALAARGPLTLVGDSEGDVTAALAAGCVPVGVTGGYRPSSSLRAAGAVAVLDNLGDLLQQLGLPATP